MAGTKIDSLLEYSKSIKNQASEAIESKVNYLEKLVKQRVSDQLPMGDLPNNITGFLAWAPTGFDKTNKGTLYQEHNKEYKDAVDELFVTIKNPPILRSEADRYELKLKELDKQLSGLADVNHKLRETNKQIREDMCLAVQDKDSEIKRLKNLLATSKNVRSM